ncbi:putative beta-glucosidase F [Ceratocystis platani]|uniref:Beta-glucosidase cel3A n=1 Tax=Ceratocystis fimbriata f. sp. platani TaxID=88771 RepID=A0A0F8B666_CERFI|nr:putative beta-glucosidase F [Ceratocystis platani]
MGGVQSQAVSAPYYPAPYGGWVPDWATSYERAKALVDNMTLAEKTNITAGTGIYMGNTGSAPRVGFPQLCLGDAANGVRLTDNVTVFPAGITTGATWDKELMYERAVAMGKEFRGKGVNIYLGPSVGPLGKRPRGGRNWEGFGSDPVLQAVGGRETVKGVQEQGVIATIKHFIGNEQEMYRMYNPFMAGYSANIDDRTLHELYLWPFAEAIHEGVGAMMTAYNAVNNSASSQNSHLINGIAKDELGFQGFVMSDWISHMSGVASALAGLDMDMPGDTQVPLLGFSHWMYDLTRSVLNGSVPITRLNDMATRVVATWYKFGQDQDFPHLSFSTNTADAYGDYYAGAWPNSPQGIVNEFVNVQEDHYLVARAVAQDAITLLKNNGSLLPLNNGQTLHIFGTDADVNPDGPNACSDRNCNKGTLGQGWGSGTVQYPYMDAPLGALKKRTENLTYYQTDSWPRNVPAATDDDVAILFISSDSGENTYTVEGNHGDRDASGLSAWYGGDKLVAKAAEHYSNVIVVAHTVGPLIVEPWVDLPSVKAVLFAHLPGQEAGESLTNVLYGDVSPSGHLPYSITHSESDLPDSLSKLVGFSLTQPQDDYSEGLYIDYRHLNKAGVKPRFAFGHGLSYTSFSFDNTTITKVTEMSELPPRRPAKGPVLNYDSPIPDKSEALAPEGFKKIFRYLYSWLQPNEANDAVADRASKTYDYPPGYSTQQKPGVRAGGGQGGNPALWDVAYTIDVVVTNTGTQHSGKAVVQAYLQFPDEIEYDTPIIQLRDFGKTCELAPGEKQTISLSLTRKDLSVWNVHIQDWVVPSLNGRFKIWLGDASDNLHLACFTDVLACEGHLESPV